MKYIRVVYPYSSVLQYRTEPNWIEQNTEENIPNPTRPETESNVCVCLCVVCIRDCYCLLSMYLLKPLASSKSSEDYTDTHKHTLIWSNIIYISQSAFHTTLSFIVVVARVRLLLSRHFFGVVFSIIFVGFYLYSSHSIVYGISYFSLSYSKSMKFFAVCVHTSVYSFIHLTLPFIFTLFQYLWVRCLTLAYQIFFASVNILWRTTPQHKNLISSILLYN